MNLNVYMTTMNEKQLGKKFPETMGIVNFLDVLRATRSLSEKVHFLYLTLIAGEFSWGKKKTAKNVQTTIRLCDENGMPQDFSIARGRVSFSEQQALM